MNEPVSGRHGDLLVDEFARAFLKDEVTPGRPAVLESAEGTDQNPVGVCVIPPPRSTRVHSTYEKYRGTHPR